MKMSENKKTYKTISEVAKILNLVNKKTVKLSTHTLRFKKSRIARNPKTLEKKIVSERNVVLFKPSKQLKSYINKKDD